MYAKEKASMAIFANACKLRDNGKLIESIKYIDSCYSKIENITPYSKFLYYQFRSSYFNKLEDYNHDELYADSQILVLKENNLDKICEGEYLQALLEKGQVLYNKGDYEAAYDFLLKARNFAYSTLNPYGMQDYNYWVAMSLFKQRKFAESANYFKEAYQMAFKCPFGGRPYYRIQEILGNIGLCYSNLEIFDTALNYYNQSLNYILINEQKINSIRMSEMAQSVIFSNLALVNIKLGRLEYADSLLNKSIAIYDKYKLDYEDLLYSKTALADLYLRRKLYKSAYLLLMEMNRNFDTSKNLRNILDIRDIDLLFSKYYEETGKKDSALVFYKKYVYCNNLVQSMNDDRIKNDFIKGIETKEHLYNIDLLKRNNKLNKLYLMFAVGFSFLLTVITIFGYITFKRNKLKNLEIKNQKEILEKINRERDKILSLVAHDLRSPLSGVIYMLELLKDDGGMAAEHEVRWNMINKSLNSSLVLINQLIGLERKNLEYEKEDYNISSLVEECVLYLQHNAKEKNQEITVDNSIEPILVSINVEKIRRLLNNLIINAIKFSNENTQINVGLEKTAKSVILFVKDNGIGIKEELIPSIFDMFTGTKRSGTAGEQSYGLGLFICKQIAEAHGGKIWVESTENIGSTFYVEIPF